MSDRFVRISLWPAFLTGLFGFAAQFYLWPEADVTWLLSVGRRMRAGEMLYSGDLVEINLPLIMQMKAAAIAVSQWLRLDAILVWRVTAGLLTLASFALAWRLLESTLSDCAADVRAAISVFLAAAATSLPGVAFGQREHLIVLGFMPYVVAAGVRAQGLPIGVRTATLVGGALALAVGIKPHYALAIPCVELALMGYLGGWRGAVRPETTVATAGVLLMAADIKWRFPTYLSSAVPMALTYYGEYASLEVLRSEVLQMALAVGAAFWPGLPRSIAVHSRLFAAAAVGAGGGFLLQGQGWVYHFLPAQTLANMATGLVALSAGLTFARGLASRRPIRWWPTSSIVAAIGLAVAFAAATGVRTLRANRGEKAQVIANVMQLVERAWPAGRPRSVANLGTSTFPAFPMAELSGAAWGSRFSCLWLMPAIEARERLAGAGHPRDPAREYLETAVVEDFVRWRPTLVVVERDTPRILDDMLKAPAFRDQWRHYQPAGEVDDVAVFVRRD